MSVAKKGVCSFQMGTHTQRVSTPPPLRPEGIEGGDVSCRLWVVGGTCEEDSQRIQDLLGQREG